MDGLIYTPRRADFLKDGSIFAHSPANTAVIALKPPLPAAHSNNRSKTEGAPATASPAPVLHAPRPCLPISNSYAKLAWGGDAMGSPQLPSFGKDDMAKQIRAKFENLVRASPLPKVVEQFVSPRGIQQTDWSSKFSRDANRVSSWHARLTPASNQSESGTSWSDKPVVGHIGHNEAAAAGAEGNSSLQISPNTRVVSPSLDQSSRQAAGQAESRLLLIHTATPADDALAKPEQPFCSSQCPAADTLKERDHAALPASQEYAKRNPAASGRAEPLQSISDAAVTQAHDPIAVRGANSTLERPEQVEQQAQPDQQCPPGPVYSAQDAGAQQAQPECGTGGIQRQDSSSMLSLSPSLKLDIPGLDDILSSDLVSENDGQATSQLQPHLQQQQQQLQHAGHHQQQDQQQQWQQHSVEQRASGSGQQDSAERSAAPAGPEASEATSDDHEALQLHVPDPDPADPKSSSLPASARSHAGAATGPAVLSLTELQAASKHGRSDPRAPEDSLTANLLAARQRLLAQGANEAVPRRSAGPHLALPAPESDAEAEQPGALLDPPEPSTGGLPRPPQATAASAVHAAGETTREGAGVQTHSDAMVDCDSLRLQAHPDEPREVTPAVAGATAQTLPAAGLHTQPAANCPLLGAEQSAMAEQQSQRPQQTSMTGAAQGSQHKRRQPSSSTTTGPSCKRRCIATRSSQGGRVQPLLTAPTDVSWQDNKGVYETSRRGRVRYPPLAFWMQETKVHDKHGGAVAIQRAAPSPATLAHPKPPLHAGPAPLARASSRAQAGAQARQPAASVTHSQAKTKSEPQAEMQSHQQTGAGLSDMDDTVGGAAAKQGQRSSKRTATSPEPALTVLPRDPPSPPFPYPILAKRAPPPSRGAPALASVKQAAQKHTLPAQSQLPADTPAAADGMAVASKKPTSKGKARRWAGASACADQAGAAVNAHRHSGNEAQAEAELSSSAAHAAVGSKAMDKAGGPANTASPKVKPKRCGSCKNCLRAKSAKQGCLVLRAAREHAHSALAAHQEPGPEPTKPTAKPTAVSVAKAKPTAAAGATAAATKPKQATLAKPGQSLAVQEGGVEAGVKPNKGCKADKAKASKAKGSKADRQARSISNDSVSKRGKACSCPQGSIHSALTQAVELASDMEKPGAVQQQQEAAEALESLKHSPVGPAPVHPAPSGLPLPTSSGQTAAGGSPEASQGGAAAAGASPAKRGRGRPRKERKPGEEIPLASVGPKRGRGRPPKSPPQPAVVDAGQAAGSAAGLPGDAAGGQPGSTAASPLPLKVKLEKDQQKLPPRATKGKAAPKPSSTAPQLNGEGSAQQPSTSDRSGSPLTGWTTEQRAALQRAYLTVQPSQRNFWQHVAKMVPGKTALQCCNCKFDELPTPLEKVKQASRLRPGRDSSPLKPPTLKLAGGRVKKPSVAATKQWARQVRWQQRAEEQSDNDSPCASHHPTDGSQQQRSNLGNSQRGAAASSLLAAIHKQDKADKYIDRILRKQGGRLRKFKAVPVPPVAGRARQQQSQQDTSGVMAELQALGRQEPVDEDMYESEQDHYFSDDDA